MRVAVICLVLALPASLRATPVSRVIYPAPESGGLRFSHETHSGSACLLCHASVRESVSSRDRNLPAEATCRPCHRAQTRGAGEAARGACATCHAGYRGAGAPSLRAGDPAHLRFSHRLHLDKGTGCADCHRLDRGSAWPSMVTCRGCHARRSAPNRCAVCHLTHKDGRLITRFASGELRPRGTLYGDVHTSQFARGHGGIAQTRRQYCESCHRAADCLRCHAGSYRPMVIHAGDYVSRHASEARRGQPRCQSCHRTQTFCVGCHQRLGVGTETAGGGFRPSTARPFHGAGWAGWSAGPGHHAYAAKRSIQTCSACHREQTCVRCHGTRASRGGGFSPHGSRFAASLKCRSLAQRNGRVCLKCHPQGDAHLQCR